MFNRVSGKNDGRSAVILNVENNELSEDAAFYCRARRPVQKSTAAASRMKISTVLGPIPSNSPRRFSKA